MILKSIVVLHIVSADIMIINLYANGVQVVIEYDDHEISRNPFLMLDYENTFSDFIHEFEVLGEL